jgi:hypothetical protein
MDNKNIKRGPASWDNGTPAATSQNEKSGTKGTRPPPGAPSRSRNAFEISSYDEANARRALGAEGDNAAAGLGPSPNSGAGAPRRRALTAGPSAKRRMLEARKGPVDRFAEAQIARLNAELDAAGDDVSAAIAGAPRLPEARPALPIINARELPLKPFVHATPDSYAMIAQKDPAYFARAKLDEHGTLHVQDVTRSYDDKGRQTRAAGLNTPDFIGKALQNFGENNVREVKWRWDGSGDSFAQFNHSISRNPNFRQAIESTRTGQLMLQAGFRVAHTEVAASHVGDSGLVYDAIDVRWERADAAPAAREPHDDELTNRVAAVDIDFEAIAKLPPQERTAALSAAARSFVQQNTFGAATRIEIDACAPEVAQCIADFAYVPVTVNGTLLDGQPAVYLPRMHLSVRQAATFDEIAWSAGAWMARNSLPPNGFVIDRHTGHPQVREWLQALADHTGSPVSWPREMVFWGDEETIWPQHVPGRASGDVAPAHRFDDSTIMLMAPLPKESELPKDSQSPDKLGSISSIGTLGAIDNTVATVNGQLRQNGSGKRVKTITLYDPTGEHSRALAQAIADQYGVTLEVTLNPAAGQNRVFVAGRDGIAATTRYEPRMRCEAVRGSVREFANDLRETVRPAGIVIHPDVLPASWREMKEASLQTLADMLNVPVALARFDGGASGEPDMGGELAGAPMAMAPEQALYRDEMLFTPQRAQAKTPLSARASGASRTPATDGSRSRVDGSRLGTREVLEAASRQVATVISDLDAELNQTRRGAGKMVPRLTVAHRRFVQTLALRANASQHLRDWRVDVTVNEWQKRYGPVDDELRARIEQWLAVPANYNGKSDFDKTMQTVYTAAVLGKEKSQEEEMRLSTAAVDARRATLAAHEEYAAARPDLMEAYEARIVSLREAWEYAQNAQRAVGRALNAAAPAQGPQTTTPEVQRFANELAAQADRAMTQLYEALDAVPEMPS